VFQILAGMIRHFWYIKTFINGSIIVNRRQVFFLLRFANGHFVDNCFWSWVMKMFEILYNIFHKYVVFFDQLRLVIDLLCRLKWLSSYHLRFRLNFIIVYYESYLHCMCRQGNITCVGFWRIMLGPGGSSPFLEDIRITDYYGII